MSSDPASVLVRVWVPDRPGALGLVASRIGAVRGDIVGVDVLERGDGVAIDEFAVRLPHLDLVQVLVREIEEVDGTSVEEVRVVRRFPDARLDALTSVTALCDSDTAGVLVERLVAHARDEFLADWSALLRRGELLASAGDDPPDPQWLDAISAGMSDSPAVAGGESGPGDLAIAPLPRHGATLLIGRGTRPIRSRERAQLLAIAEVADRVWELLPDREPG